jgi:hypothetical protein
MVLANCSPAPQDQSNNIKVESKGQSKAVENTAAKPEIEIEPLVKDEYPVYTANYYNEGKLINKYMDQEVAIEGTLLDTKPGPDGRPIYQLQLSGGVDKTLWVGSLVKVVGKGIEKGQTLRVLGFFDQTSKEPDYIGKLTDDDEYLIGFCFHNQDTGLPVYLNKLMHRCIQWQNNQPVDGLKQ